MDSVAIGACIPETRDVGVTQDLLGVPAIERLKAKKRIRETSVNTNRFRFNLNDNEEWYR